MQIPYTLEDIVRDITSIPNAGDGNLVLNLAELIKAVGQVHHIVTAIPSDLSDNRLNYRALALWASRTLISGGLYILIGKPETFPTDTNLLTRELQFMATSEIASTGEIALIFQKPNKMWHGALSKALNRRFWSIPKQFKNLSDVIAQLTRKNEVILDPFKDELNIAQAAKDRAFIGANCGLIENFTASMEVTPCQH